MKKKYLIFVFLLIGMMRNIAQDIPKHISYYRIYEFIDELATDGLIEINSAVKPYSQQFIAERLQEVALKIKK